MKARRLDVAIDFGIAVGSGSAILITVLFSSVALD
jgi:hypothetical protein